MDYPEANVIKDCMLFWDSFNTELSIIGSPLSLHEHISSYLSV